MRKFNLLFFSFLILAASALFIIGCSASSYTLRYKEKTDHEKKEDNQVRFSSERDRQNLNDTTMVADTINISNDTSDIDSDPDDIPANETDVDVSSLLKKYSGSGSNNEFNADKSNIREKMLMEIIKYLNTPYKYGGNTKKGIDCSAFTKAIYEKTFSITLERNARQQFREGEVINDMEDLKFGDLVFFNTRRRVRPGHVGIYIGDHLFAHASVKYGVTISSLDNKYYSKRFMGGRRIENLVGSAKFTGNN